MFPHLLIAGTSKCHLPLSGMSFSLGHEDVLLRRVVGEDDGERPVHVRALEALLLNVETFEEEDADGFVADRWTGSHGRKPEVEEAIGTKTEPAISGLASSSTSKWASTFGRRSIVQTTLPFGSLLC